MSLVPSSGASHHRHLEVDVFSYAMVVYEIVCREVPFEQEEPHLRLGGPAVVGCGPTPASGGAVSRVNQNGSLIHCLLGGGFMGQ